MSIPFRPAIPQRVRKSLDPAANKLQEDLQDPDDQRRESNEVLDLIAAHYKFIDTQQRRELGIIEGHSSGRTTTTTLLLGGFGLGLQRATSEGAGLEESMVWLIVVVVAAMVYLLSLLLGVISNRNVGRGHADDLAMDAGTTWERMLSLPAEEVRYDITKSLATACVNTEALLRWKRRWSQRATAAMVGQGAAVAVLLVVSAVRTA